MNTTLKPICLIVDFSAGNIITHHLNYVLTYGKFLKEHGYKVKMLLPKYTPTDQNLDEFDVYKVLLSREYRLDGPRISVRRIYYYFLNKINKIGKFVDYVIGRILTKIYLLIAVKELVKILHSEKSEYVIIFPSTDLMAIRFMSLLLKKKIRIKSFFVRINAVNKNLIDENLKFDGLELLSRLLIDNKSIHVGCETKSLVRLLQKKGDEYKKARWIPLPSAPRLRSNSQGNSIGFLGGAKRRKGFDEIPKWINKLEKTVTDPLFLIQTSPFPWPGYEKTIADLNEKNNVEFIDSIINNEELFDQISRCIYVVTPYDKLSYNLVGSSIFYYACDFLIPTISYDYLGFSDDINEFQCGVLIRNLSDEIQVDLSLHETRAKLVEKLIIYNNFRNSQNLSFFKLS
jgi:glycosyltransferase involved in cell wall biosynthesis